MDYIDLYKNALHNWENDLQNDEWFFSKLHKRITDNLSAENAFECITLALEYLIQEQNPFLFYEGLILLQSIIRISDTTEIPKGLDSNLKLLENRFNKKYEKEISEIKNWYRLI